MFVRTGLWRHPDFLRLWAGQTVSLFGSLIGRFALALTAVTLLDAGPGELAILAGAQTVPGFALGLVAGVWVDRLSRRAIMIAVDLARFAVILTVPVAWAFDALTMAQLWAVGFVTAAGAVIFEVAYEAYLPTLVSKEELVEGNSKLTGSASVAEVMGFSAAGWLVQLLRGPGAMLLDALTFLWSAFWLWRIRTPEAPPPPATQRSHVLLEAREGLRATFADPVLRALALSGALFWASTSIITVYYLVFLTQEQSWQPGVLGLIFAIGGVTSLGGSLVAGRTLPGGIGPSLVVARLIAGVSMLFMPLTPGVTAVGLACLVAAQLVGDPAWTYYEINLVSLRQAIVGERLLGRVNASMRVLEFGGMLGGLGLAALLGAFFSAREALFFAAAVSTGAALFLAVSPVMRLRRVPLRVEEVSAAA